MGRKHPALKGGMQRPQAAHRKGDLLRSRRARTAGAGGKRPQAIGAGSVRVRRDGRAAGTCRPSDPVDDAGEIEGSDRRKRVGTCTPGRPRGRREERGRGPAAQPHSARKRCIGERCGEEDEPARGHRPLAFTGGEAPSRRAAPARALLALWAHVNVHGLNCRTLIGRRSPSPTFGCTEYGTTFIVGTRWRPIDTF